MSDTDFIPASKREHADMDCSMMRYEAITGIHDDAPAQRATGANNE